MRRVAREVAGIGVVAAVWAAGIVLWHPMSPWKTAGLARVAMEELAGRGVLWVDARAAGGHAAWHPGGVVWLNEESWMEGMGEFMKVWQPGVAVVVFCGGPRCGQAEAVAARLRDLGVEPLYVLKGGTEELRAWEARHGKVD